MVYYITELIMTVKVLMYCGLYYKSFTTVIYYYNDSMITIYDHNHSTSVIYDCNDSGQYYKTMILANFALARSINYNCKVCSKLKHTL